MEENAVYKVPAKYTFVVRTTANLCVQADSAEEALAKLQNMNLDSVEIIGKLLNKETDINE